MKLSKKFVKGVVCGILGGKPANMAVDVDGDRVAVSFGGCGFGVAKGFDDLVNLCHFLKGTRMIKMEVEIG